MGKNRHKSKSKPPAADKEVSEADAAAGMMVAERKEKEEKPKKRALEEKPLTRKQKRQKLHEKNKWPQHPNITDPAQRERAYLRVAGIEAVSQEQEDETKFPGLAKDKKKKLEEDDDEWRHFGRFLGGTDARTRHKAVKRLGQYLQAKSGFGLNGPDIDAVVGLSELDLLKLWKGLWFTLYMADKAPVQDELAKHISKLMWCVAGDQETDEFAAQAYLDMEAQDEMAFEEEQQLAEGEDDEDDEDVKILSTRVVEMEDSDEEEEEEDDSRSDESDKDMEEADEEIGAEEDEEDPEKTPHIRGAPLAMLMMRTFFRTLLREWGNMDKYRIDKFYTLVRYMVREIYRYMAKRQWSLGIIKLFNDAVTEEALVKPPNGVRYHLIDIALEELVMVATKDGVAPVTEAIFLEIMEPYFAMAQHGFGDKMVQARVVEKVLEKFLLEFSVCSESEDKEKVLEEVHVGTISSFIFEMASTEDTLGIHRKSLYDMHKTYERQRKKTGTDIAVDTSFQKPGEEEDDEDEDYATEDMEAEREEETLEQMGFEAEEDEEEEEAEPKESKKDKKKNKKEKKEKKKKKARKEEEEEEEEVSEEAVETPTKTKSEKKKSKKSKSASKGDMDTTQHGNDHEEGKASSKKHKKKKKKEKGVSDEDDEDVVTISKEEQKKAKKALEDEKQQLTNAQDEDSDDEKSKKKKKKKKKKDKDNEEESEDKKKKKTIKRRVSFDNHNRARSWKASMAGLRHLDPSESISKTPEKSILLNKGKKGISKSLSPKSRKRATDYF